MFALLETAVIDKYVMFCYLEYFKQTVANLLWWIHIIDNMMIFFFFIVSAFYKQRWCFLFWICFINKMMFYRSQLFQYKHTKDVISLWIHFTNKNMLVWKYFFFVPSLLPLTNKHVCFLCVWIRAVLNIHFGAE